MNVLYIDYNMYGKNDIINAFESLGCKVEVTDMPLLIEDKNVLSSELYRLITQKKPDAVFTSNYYPLVSDVCEKVCIKYISWTYDSPLIALYHPSVKNTCNYIFSFDSEECNELKKKGVSNVYYMPLAVNSERLSEITISDADKKLFSADVSLVASLYNEEHNLYDRMSPKLTEYTRGYLEAVMQAQKNLFGAFILEDVLKDENILGDMLNAMPYKLVEGSLSSLEYVYANYFLSRKTASMQRLEFIKIISGLFEMKVYSPGDLSEIPSVKHMGTVDYLTDMNKVFRLSKINLNITLPSIHSGCPLRAMDILGNGGFLLTNYQKDMVELFEPNEEFVYFTSLEDAVFKIEYYLTHDEERERIAKNAKLKMERNFTFKTQISRILKCIS